MQADGLTFYYTMATSVSGTGFHNMSISSTTFLNQSGTTYSLTYSGVSISSGSSNAGTMQCTVWFQ